MFDVGAHFGETVRLFNKNLNIKKIYSFEASPKNFQMLQKNISEYDVKKIEIHNYGIGDKISNNFINQALESSSSTINKLNINSNYFKKKLKILNIKKKMIFIIKFQLK